MYLRVVFVALSMSSVPEIWTVPILTARLNNSENAK